MMNCRSCGAQLPAGVAFCQNCGTPAPYNTPENTPGSANVGPVDPTLVANPYGTLPAPPSSTSYGSDPYAPPPPPPPAGNPYEAAPGPYGSTSYGSAPYAPNPYQAQPLQPGAYGVQPGYPAPMPAPKRRSRLGLILGIVALVVILVAVGLVFALYQVGKTVLNADATATAQAHATAIAGTSLTPGTTATTATTPPSAQATAPSGNPLDPTASAIITSAQMSSAIDSNYNPTHLTTTFAVNQNIYVTYNLNLNSQTGYIQVKWYIDNTVGATKIFPVKLPDTHGYFGETYKLASTGAVELYWCTQSDCSDAKLGQFATFTVSSSSVNSATSQPLADRMAVRQNELEQ